MSSKVGSALSGAAAGAAAGTAVLPGVGTVIGGLLGGIGSLFGGGDDPTNPQLPPITDPVTGQQISQSQANTTDAMNQQQNFVNAVNAQHGLANQSQVYNQLQGIANGTGPNPAQAMLNQATGTNVANQAALMASQRGAGANTGLIARQAAQQGANIQQQAAGQGASMQANQSLNAIGAAGNLANQQAGQQANAVGNLNQFAQGNQGQILNAAGQYNNAITTGQGNVNTNNQNIANNNQTQQGGLLNGLGGSLTAIGGMFKPGSTGGGTLAGGADTISNAGSMFAAEGGSVPSSFVARHLKGLPQYAKGGKVDAMVSPGERYLPPKEVEKVAEGKKSPMKAGEKIPGKPKVGGSKNSYANDTVPKKLESGGIVLPRSVTQSKDPAKSAHAFVTAILAKQGGPKK